MAAADDKERPLPASVRQHLEAFDGALRQAPHEACLEAAACRGWIFDTFVGGARAALVDEVLRAATVPLPRFAEADRHALAGLIEDDEDVDTAESLRALALEAAVERAVLHAKNMARGGKDADLDKPIRVLQGAPSDMPRLLGDDRCRAEPRVGGHALGARAEHALVASHMAYFGGEDNATLETVRSMWRSATARLDTDRFVEHEAVYLFEEPDSVAPTVLVRTPDAGNTLYVAACGSRGNVRDWALTNFKIARKEVLRARPSSEAPDGTPAGEVMQTHLGFWQAFKAQAARVIEAVQEELKGDEEPVEVVFTGHSLGGAVARLLALEWAAVSGTRPRLVTFGCPRGGDEALHRRVLEATVYQRVRTPGDPVPGKPDHYVADRAHQHWIVHDEGEAYRQAAATETAQWLYHVGQHSLYQYASGLLAHYDVLQRQDLP